MPYQGVTAGNQFWVVEEEAPEEDFRGGYGQLGQLQLSGILGVLTGCLFGMHHQGSFLLLLYCLFMLLLCSIGMFMVFLVRDLLVKKA